MQMQGFAPAAQRSHRSFCVSVSHFRSPSARLSFLAGWPEAPGIEAP